MYGNALMVLLGGVLLFGFGWYEYARQSKWLTNSKKTEAEVVGLENVEIRTENGTHRMDRPTFRYRTTGEILVAKVNQLFEKNTLKVGDRHRVRYNAQTPGRILSDSADDLPLLTAFGSMFLGGLLLMIALVLFLV